jgi:hypothetical protein
MRNLTKGYIETFRIRDIRWIKKNKNVLILIIFHQFFSLFILRFVSIYIEFLTNHMSTNIYRVIYQYNFRVILDYNLT